MSSALVWFRRDLRNFDHAALYHALKAFPQVYCAFVFDTDILDALQDNNDRRISFIWQAVHELNEALQLSGSTLMTLHGRAELEIPKLAQQLGVHAVYSNHDYEPAAKARDKAVARALQQTGIFFPASRIR